MAATTYAKLLRYGTQSGYDALATKNPDLLYFTDAGKLYKGTIDYTNPFLSTASIGEGAGIAGKIYIDGTTNEMKTYVGNAWKNIGSPVTQSVDDTTPSAVKVPSEAALVDYVGEIVAGDGVKSIAQKVDGQDNPVVGTFQYTTGSGSSATTTDVQLTGVAGTPTWNSTTRELTIPVVGGTTVVATIGKDIYIDPEAENGYNPTTKTIDIYLNDGDASHDPTLVAIPVSALVEDYVGEDTATVDLSVDDNHVFTANVKLSTVANNALTTQSDGLYISLEAYATTAAVDTRFTNVESTVSALNSSVSTLNGKVSTLEGDYTTAGSVDYKIYNATTASSLKLADHESRIAQLELDLPSLAAAATTWGTFTE